MAFCEVIVDIVHENVDKVFTYRVPEGMRLEAGMRVQIPFGPRKIEGYVVRLTERSDIPCKCVIRPLEDYPALLPHMMCLAVELSHEAHCPLAETIRLMIPAQMRGERVKPKEEEMVSLSVDAGVLAQVIASLNRAPRQAQVLAALAEAKGRAVTMEALRAQIPDCRAAVNALVKKQMITVKRQEVLRAPVYSKPDICGEEPELTPSQSAVLGELLPALCAGTGRFLLYGVTGSGKTEVYIRAVKDVLARGKTAIVLVPEIALTPQMVDWFKARFGQGAAVLHSRLSAGQRFDEWRRIRKGDARVVIGARSAIFAPLENLGVVIVDEEHEQSYIADNSPRYDAREVARMRCENEGGTLLLASATPSMRSFALAQRGDLTLLELPARVNNRPMPEVHLVDMREELEMGNHTIFSGALMEGMKRCLEGGHQAILFVNRRGYSTFVSCRSCGYIVKCPNCDVSMTYHQDGEMMQCHYCGHQEKPPTVCPSCQSHYIRYFGTGTQKVEQEMQRYFPGVPLLRMDNDTTRTRDAHHEIIGRFRRQEARVLIGTQMIAKGLDFPNVTLVGVIAADAMLGLPDYRASERTFQLITQVAGRAGRAQCTGEVFVQTYTPDHYSIQTAARQDFRAFYEQEMRRRRQQLFPPFTQICRLLIEAAEQPPLIRTAQALSEQMNAFMQRHTGLARQLISMRSMEPPVRMIRKKYRWQVVVKLIDVPASDPIVEKMTELSRVEWPGAQVFLEINPSSMV